ncbi:DUF1835 domain-containing protein [Marinifilum sp. N1E240]|uniref:DUF1835 domain-containing protein n=1 Tax=Marinifilum sp. N1E240 TaxID=2608082 RepID=UPI00128C88C2|nr:DUF1835 domain-containing protein [Marinifilum sp. N1E240]MPQ46377.1 DUF1835 domain-containing protein [Marinifilum sp. N1E240]
MQRQHHILNGDCLKEMFPKNSSGEQIVMREFLVEGDVLGESLDELLQIRAKYICGRNLVSSEEEYHQKSSVEIKKILTIGVNDEVNLWFEDDLFCQVNFWFVLNLLYENHKRENIYLVRPNKGNEYNFGNMNHKELSLAFHHRQEIKGKELKQIRQLWRYYQKEKWSEMIRVAELFQEKFPFLLPAVYAQINRLSKGNDQGRPIESLKKIMKDLNTTEFALVFKEFCKREAIYGFGDIQVRCLYDDILRERADN